MDVPLESLEISIIGRLLKKHQLLRKKYLEVGCGDGFNLERFEKWGMQGVGIDLSAQALQRAKAKRFRSVKLLEGDFLHTEIPDQPSLIFMLNMLEHVHRDTDCMKKAFDLLAPQGHVVIAVPANSRAYGFADANAGHVRRYEEKELRDKLASAGFDIVEWRTVGFPTNRSYTWLFNFLNRARLQALDESQTAHSGIRHDSAYYGGGFDGIAKVAYPILSLVIQLDRLFAKTKLGNNFVVIARKRGHH